MMTMVINLLGLENPDYYLGIYIMVEKEGEDESGQFITSILNSKIPLNAYMNVMQDELQKNLSLQNTQINFTEVKESYFAGADALICTFRHNSAGLDYRGELKTFHCGERTVYIFIQEASDDISENKDGFKMMNSSFSCG